MKPEFETIAADLAGLLIKLCLYNRSQNSR